MFKKQLSMAIRHLVKYRVYSFLNLAGLTVGMACALIIIIWIDHNISMDRFHRNCKNIYKVLRKIEFENGQINIGPSVSGSLAPSLIKEVPEIKNAVRITWMNKLMFSGNDQCSFENGFYADSTFFSIFSYNLIHGNPSVVLCSPDYAVISEKLAKKYFGNTSVVGRTITIGEDELFTIAGVFEDTPVTSSFEFDFVLPFSNYYKRNKNFVDRWDNSDLMTFVLVNINTSRDVLLRKMTDVAHRYDKDAAKNKLVIFGQPIGESYLFGDFGRSIEKPSGKIVLIRIMTLVTLIIILLACLNYINMATALATKRDREIGMKIILGSGRKNLVIQFLAESLTLSFISFFISYTLVHLFLPLINRTLQENITHTVDNKLIIATICILPLITGLLAGLIPAIRLSARKPLSILKNNDLRRHSRAQTRYMLIVFQFVITISFILISIVVYRQVKYIRNKDLGLNKDNIIFFNQYSNILTHREAFKNELKNLPGVLDVSYVLNNPLIVNSYIPCRGSDNTDEFLTAYIVGDGDFTRTLGIEIIEGNDGDGDFSLNNTNILINEEMAKSLGYDNPIGQPVRFGTNMVIISGVVKNFNFNSLRIPIKEIMIFCGFEGTDLVMVRIKEDRIPETIKAIEVIFSEFENTIPFEYSFLDAAYYNQYRSEQSMGKLSGFFTIIAIIISCSGLFGFTLFTTEQRIREISIRKVFGAGTPGIMTLLISDFAKWIILSYIISGVIAYYILNKWLQFFAYHIRLNWWIFVLAGLLTAAIALVTISWRCWRSANSNPLASLKYE